MVAALDSLAAQLVAERPADAAAYTERLQAYLEAHPAFFGSAAALLDRSGAVISSPYVYRTADGYVTKDIAVPSYNIERRTGSRRHWPRMPASGRRPTLTRAAVRHG